MSKHPIETYLTHLREIRDTGGGSQVIKKWLSYREKGLLGRGLTLDEVETVTQMVRRLAALVALAAELDDNYRRAAAAAWGWPAAETSASR